MFWRKFRWMPICVNRTTWHLIYRCAGWCMRIEAIMATGATIWHFFAFNTWIAWHHGRLARFIAGWTAIERPIMSIAAESIFRRSQFLRTAIDFTTLCSYTILLADNVLAWYSPLNFRLWWRWGYWMRGSWQTTTAINRGTTPNRWTITWWYDKRWFTG